jgi:hypothetical protein
MGTTDYRKISSVKNALNSGDEWVDISSSPGAVKMRITLPGAGATSGGFAD